MAAFGAGPKCLFAAPIQNHDAIALVMMEGIILMLPFCFAIGAIDSSADGGDGLRELK